MAWKTFLLLCSAVVWHSAVAGDYYNFADYIKQHANNETFVRMFQEHLRHFQYDPEDLKVKVPFPCQHYPQPKSHATSVHNLTPMDIKVIGAMGDSITAGTGIEANNIVEELIEDRGLSWSIGGDKAIDQVDTLANVIKSYNPDLVGYSEGWGPVWWEPSSHLNVAKPGAKAKDMPGQAELLVKRMKKNPKIDFQNDWKVITIFVGGNDLCRFCYNKKKYGAESYKANLQKALDYLHANVPRAFVNLVDILPITVVKDLNQNLLCDVFHLIGCGCAAYPLNSKAEDELKAETKKYRDVMEELINSGRYDTRDDFTVVDQPFFKETYPPEKPGGNGPDLSYFAPDCFHLSLKGHRAAADALWNNMVEPFGKKRIKWTPGELVECPDAKIGQVLKTSIGDYEKLRMGHPYIYTKKNSNAETDPKSKVDLAQNQGTGHDNNGLNLKPKNNAAEKQERGQGKLDKTVNEPKLDSGGNKSEM